MKKKTRQRIQNGHPQRVVPRVDSKVVPFEMLITEAAYPGNIGFIEMAKFYQRASTGELKKMEKVIKAEDWDGFKKLIQKSLGIKLK